MSTNTNLNIIKSVVTPPSSKAKNKKSQEFRQPQNATSIEEAVKGVAAELGGNIKQTESELLAKLLQQRKGAATAEDASLRFDILLKMFSANVNDFIFLFLVI